MTSNKKILFTFLSVLLLFSLFKDAPAFAAGSDAVNIPDANLKTVILKQLNKGSSHIITKQDMQSINTLMCSGYDLQNNQLADASFLDKFTGLEVVDLEAISNLTQLKTLCLSNNEITDFSPLQNLDITDFKIDNQHV